MGKRVEARFGNLSSGPAPAAHPLPAPGPQRPLAPVAQTAPMRAWTGACDPTAAAGADRRGRSDQHARLTAGRGPFSPVPKCAVHRTNVPIHPAGPAPPRRLAPPAYFEAPAAPRTRYTRVLCCVRSAGSAAPAVPDGTSAPDLDAPAAPASCAASGTSAERVVNAQATTPQHALPWSESVAMMNVTLPGVCQGFNFLQGDSYLLSSTIIISRTTCCSILVVLLRCHFNASHCLSSDSDFCSHTATPAKEY